MVLLLVALVVLFVFIFQSYKQSTSPPFFLLSKQPGDERQRLHQGIEMGGWPDTIIFFWETEIFVAQPACHAQCVRPDQVRC
jgi:hypothetical protein